MIKLAVIGTNWITDRFIDAALLTKRFELTAVYSRELDRARQFADQYGADIACFDDFEQFAQSDAYEAVYIASPNSFHAPQAIALLNAGKHVACEKPLTSSDELAQQMYRAAEDNQRVLFEAFMSPHRPNFKILKAQLSSIGAIRQAMISYCQYSSRYPKYLNGENPNTFNPAFSNGSIMDIGYYCLASAVELFGEPKAVQATAHLLDSGVDGNGSVVMSYDGFDVVLNHSKTSNSYLNSEIQGEDAALLVEMISTAQKVVKIPRGSEPQDLSVEQQSNPMFDEAHVFADQVQSNAIDPDCKRRSLLVAKLLKQIRQQTGVVFPTDNTQ